MLVSFSATLGDDADLDSLVSVGFTLGDGIVSLRVLLVVTTLGSFGAMGNIVARLSICARCTYEFVVCDP